MSELYSSGQRGSEVGGDMGRVTNNHVTRDINNRDIPMTHSHLWHSSLSPIFCKNIVKHLFGPQGRRTDDEGKIYSHLLCVSFSEWMCFGNALVKCASQDSVYLASSHTRLTHTSSWLSENWGWETVWGVFFLYKNVFYEPKMLLFCLSVHALMSCSWWTYKIKIFYSRTKKRTK